MLSHITDHGIRGILKLVARFWGKPRMATILLAPLQQLQDVEDTIADIMRLRQVDNADDARLAILGRQVRQGNYAFTTEEFRSAIKARIRANRASGKLDDLHEVTKLITAKAYTRWDIGPAELAFIFIDSVAVPLNVLRHLLPSAKAGGQRLMLFTGEQGDDDLQLFGRWSGAPPAESGWGWSGSAIGNKAFHVTNIGDN